MSNKHIVINLFFQNDKLVIRERHFYVLKRLVDKVDPENTKISLKLYHLYVSYFKRA